MSNIESNDQARNQGQVEEALQRQQEIADKAIAEQKRVQDKLSLEVARRHQERLENWRANRNEPGLPDAPKPPATMLQGSHEQVQFGKNALQAYQEAGYLAAPADVPGASSPNAADRALNVEKEFRERQQQLAERISDPATSPEQRERLNLQKMAEYHHHKAEQLTRIIETQSDIAHMYGGDDQATDQFIRDRETELDQHKTQAALAAQQLHSFDKERAAVPKEVRLQLENKEQHNTSQAQMSKTSDLHLDAMASVNHQLENKNEASTGKEAAEAENTQQTEQKSQDLAPATNPAAARLRASIERERGSGPAERTQEADRCVEALRSNQERLAAAQVQKQEGLGQKAELEQRAAVRR